MNSFFFFFFFADKMTEVDVGLKPNMPFFRAEETEKPPRITYLHLYDCDKFSVCKKKKKKKKFYFCFLL